MTILPGGHDWGQVHGTTGRRMHIVDWEATAQYGVSTLAVCGMVLDSSHWTDENWAQQARTRPDNPARPCPNCVMEVKG